MDLSKLEERLQQAGYEVLGRDVDVELEGGKQERIDLLLQHDGERMVVKVTQTDPDSFLQTTSYRLFAKCKAITELDEYENATPLIILITDHYDTRYDNKIQNLFDNYAPEYEFLVTNSEKEKLISSTRNDGIVNDVKRGNIGRWATSTAGAELSYTDLDLFLAKFIYYSSEETEFSDLGSDEPIRNPNHLDDETDVSRRKCYLFVDEMEEKGLIKRTDEALLIPDPEAYVDYFTDEYSVMVNPLVSRLSVDYSIEEFKRRLRSISEGKHHDLIVTGGFGLHQYSNSDEFEKPVELYWTGENLEGLRESLEAEEVDSAEGANIYIHQPKLVKAITEMSVVKDGCYVVDSVQLHLDCAERSDMESVELESIR